MAESFENRGSVLVVEDCEVQSRTYLRVLRSRGYTGTALGTLAAALEATTRDAWLRRPFDIVIADLQLGDEHALPLIEHAVGLTPAPLVAVVTGHLDAALSLRFVRLGVMSFPKPFSTEHVDTLLQLVEHKRDRGLAAFARRFDLSSREAEALRHALDRCPHSRAAERMGISANTLREYWTRIFDKTGLRSRDAVLSSIDARSPSSMPPVTSREEQPDGKRH